jgi:uncharacterized protein YukJ
VGGKRYCVVTGRILDRRAEMSGRSPHYQILVQGGAERFRIAVNTRSGSSHGREAHLLYFANDDFRHEIVDHLARIEDGVRDLAARPGGLAIDYVRGGMVERGQMRLLPDTRPGPRNDLVDEIDYRIDRARADPRARLHAFGTRWGPEPRQPDQLFGFRPGNGIHDVHMNQGSRDEHRNDNAIWRDGALIFHEPRRDRWCALFLAFQTQAWQTDAHGDPLPPLRPRHASWGDRSRRARNASSDRRA